MAGVSPIGRGAGVGQDGHGAGAGAGAGAWAGEAEMRHSLSSTGGSIGEVFGFCDPSTRKYESITCFIGAEDLTIYDDDLRIKAQLPGHIVRDSVAGCSRLNQKINGGFKGKFRVYIIVTRATDSFTVKWFYVFHNKKSGKSFVVQAGNGDGEKSLRDYGEAVEGNPKEVDTGVSSMSVVPTATAPDDRLRFFLEVEAWCSQGAEVAWTAEAAREEKG